MIDVTSDSLRVTDSGVRSISAVWLFSLEHHLDHDYCVNFRSDLSSKVTNVDEIEANFFAASILMPKQFLDELDVDEAVADDEKVAELAKLFDVSRHAMSLRLVNLYEEYVPF